MKLEGLAKIGRWAVEAQDVVNEKIDENPHCVSTTKGEAIDNDLNAAWQELDTIIEAVKSIQEIKVGLIT